MKINKSRLKMLISESLQNILESQQAMGPDGDLYARVSISYIKRGMTRDDLRDRINQIGSDNSTYTASLRKKAIEEYKAQQQVMKNAGFGTLMGGITGNEMILVRLDRTPGISAKTLRVAAEDLRENRKSLSNFIFTRRLIMMSNPHRAAEVVTYTKEIEDSVTDYCSDPVVRNRILGFLPEGIIEQSIVVNRVNGLVEVKGDEMIYQEAFVKSTGMLVGDMQTSSSPVASTQPVQSQPSKSRVRARVRKKK